jgi:hypothetical protein
VARSPYRWRMRDLRKILAILVLGAGISPALAQDTLPEGPGMPETVKACGGCHGVGIFRNIRRTDVMWEVTITNMIGFGMTIGDDEFDTVLAYLATYMGLSPPPPTVQPAPPPK